MEKAAKVLYFVSLLFFLTITSLSYAYLPIQVSWLGSWAPTMHKESFFFSFILLIVITNLAIGFLQFRIANIRLAKNWIFVQNWLMGLKIIINFYLAIIIGYVAVLNNSQHIEPKQFVYVIYVGLSVLVFWLARFVFLFGKSWVKV